MIKEGFQPAMQAKLPSAFFFLVVLIWVTAVTYTRGKEFLSHLGIIEGFPLRVIILDFSNHLSPITYILIGFIFSICILYKNSKRFYSLVLLKRSPLKSRTIYLSQFYNIVLCNSVHKSLI